MNLKDYRLFACFNYTSTKCKFHKLGDVVINSENEIGVIIQVHEDQEYRTDMFGNCSRSEIKIATKAQIKEHRPNLLEMNKKHENLRQMLFNLIEEYKSVKRFHDEPMDGDDVDGFVDFIKDETNRYQGNV